MCLAQTWHIPGVDLPRTPACPALPPAPGPAAGRGGSAVPQLEPGHRPPAAPPPAPPRGQPRHQPQPPAIFRLTTAGPQLRHPRPPRSVTSTRTTPPAAWTVTVTVFPAAPGPLCRTLFPNSSLTSRAASSRHGCPGPGTPAVNARATRARSARPATVTLSRTTALATSAPAFPARPAARETTRDRSRAHGDARPARRPASSRGHAAGAARPWPSVEQPTVRTDRDGARIPSAYLHRRGDRKWFRGGPVYGFGACFTVLPCPDCCRFLRAGGRVRGREAPAQQSREVKDRAGLSRANA